MWRPALILLSCLVVLPATAAPPASADDAELLAPLTPKKGPRVTKKLPKPGHKGSRPLAPVPVAATQVLVSLAAPVSGAHLLIDGKDLGTLPLPAQPVTPGFHEVVVRRSGYNEAYQRFSITQGQRVEISVPLEAIQLGKEKPPAPPEVATPPIEEPSQPHVSLSPEATPHTPEPTPAVSQASEGGFFSHWYAWVGVGVVAAGVAAAGGYGIARAAQRPPGSTQVCSGTCAAVIQTKPGTF